MWTCLEIDLWSEPNLPCQDIRSLVHKNQQLQLEPLANTIYESAMAVGSRRNLDATRTPPEVLWCVSLYEVMTNNDQQRMISYTNITQSCLPSFGLHLFPFQTLCAFLCVLYQNIACPFILGYFQKNTMYLFSAEHAPMCMLNQNQPLIRQFPEKHHMTQLSLLRNQKFPLKEIVFFQAPYNQGIGSICWCQNL